MLYHSSYSVPLTSLMESIGEVFSIKPQVGAKSMAIVCLAGAKSMPPM